MVGSDKPIIYLNFKTYEQGTGKNALKLAKIAEAFSKETGISVVPIVQAVDLRMVADSVSIPVFAQFMDPVGYGANTGAVLPEAVKEAGASGIVVNHAERQVPLDVIKATVERAKQLSLKTIVCATTPEEAVAFVEVDADCLSLEPPELIGKVSVAKANPGIISDFVKAVREKNDKVVLLAGAGISDASDVAKSAELGCLGVLLASAVMKAEDPLEALRKFVG